MALSTCTMLLLRSHLQLLYFGESRFISSSQMPPVNSTTFYYILAALTGLRVDFFFKSHWLSTMFESKECVVSSLSLGTHSANMIDFHGWYSVKVPIRVFCVYTSFSHDVHSDNHFTIFTQLLFLGSLFFSIILSAQFLTNTLLCKYVFSMYMSILLLV